MTASPDPYNAAELEVVDAEPVPDGMELAQTTQPTADVERRRRGSLAPVLSNRAAQAAALTLSGFAAGAVTAFVSSRAKHPRPRRLGSRVRGRTVATRSFVVDVHLLDR